MDFDQGELFDGDTYWRPYEPKPVAPPPPPPPPSFAQQLGWDNQQRGAIAQAEFDLKMIRLGANPHRPATDPGGGIASDTTVVFNRRVITVQVKSAMINKEGRAEFKLGPREGARTSTRDGRRALRYLGRADFFALAVFNEDTVITDWYLIPAERLRLRVTLTVVPGKRSYVLRSVGFDPERFRDAWERMLDIATIPRDSRTSQNYPMGQFRPRTEE